MSPEDLPTELAQFLRPVERVLLADWLSKQTYERNRNHYLQAATLLVMSGLTVHQMTQYALTQVVIELWEYDGRKVPLENVAGAYAAVHNAVGIGPVTKMVVEAVRDAYRA